MTKENFSNLIRWFARILSISMIAFFMTFFISSLFGPEDAINADAMSNHDFLILSLCIIMSIGLLFAWKFEFSGALLSLLAYIILATVHPNVILSPYLIYPLSSVLFIISWYLHHTDINENNKITD